MMLGLDERTKQVYEGDSYSGYGVLPPPVLSLATVIQSEADFSSLPANCDLFVANLLFREDSFDAVTRIRRGRLYKAYPERPSDWRVISHAIFDGHTSGEQRRLVTFDSRSVSHDRASFESALLALGTRDAFSLWRVVNMERLISGEDFLTLRARSSLGVLPEVNEAAIPVDAKAKVIETLRKLSEAAYRAGPESVVDRARDVAQWCIACWLAEKEGDPRLRNVDLGQLVSKLPDKDYPAIRGVAGALARLHVRNKPNEQEKYNTRPVTEDDAEFSIAAVGLMLREIGWARQ